LLEAATNFFIISLQDKKVTWKNNLQETVQQKRRKTLIEERVRRITDLKKLRSTARGHVNSFTYFMDDCKNAFQQNCRKTDRL